MFDYNKELITMLKVANELKNEYDINDKNIKLPKIISFEGLAGSGKSTQLDLVKEELRSKGLKVFTMELPGDNGISILLSSLYKNKKEWDRLIKINPWINTFFIALDFRLMVEKIAKEGYEYILMSRGLFSSIYYTIYNYTVAGASEEEAIKNAVKLCNIIIKPEIIIFLDLEIEEALNRIEIRNRLPRRDSDSREGLEISLDIYNKLFDIYSNDVTIHRIKAMMNKYEVKDTIIEIVGRYVR